jgi:hypothetical protein
MIQQQKIYVQQLVYSNIFNLGKKEKHTNKKIKNYHSIEPNLKKIKNFYGKYQNLNNKDNFIIN